MSRYSPDSAGLLIVEKVSGVAGRLTLAGLRTVLGVGREPAGRLTGLAATAVRFAVVTGLTAVLGLRAVRGLVALPGLMLADAALAVAVLGLAAWALVAVTLGLAVFGFAAVRDAAVVRALAVVRDLAVVALRADVALVPAGFAGLLRAAGFFGAGLLAGAAIGLTADIVLAAAASALAATVIDLVAAFMAASAVDMVFADDVALVAAVVIRPAAEVTFAAAEETVRAAVAGVWPAILAVAGLAAERALGLLATRRVVPLPVRARVVFAAPRRTGLRAVDCRGIDLPP